MKATVTFSVDGTVQPQLEIEGGHLLVTLFCDHPGDTRASVMVCDRRGGPVRRHVLIRQAWLIDKEVGDG